MQSEITEMQVIKLTNGGGNTCHDREEIVVASTGIKKTLITVSLKCLNSALLKQFQSLQFRPVIDLK